LQDGYRERLAEGWSDLEKRLMQAQKAESLGRMAGAIAHHFNNMLAAVIGNLELASLEESLQNTVAENIREARVAAQRATDMGHLMLTYLGQRTGKRKPTHLTELFRETLPMIHAILPEKALLQTHFEEPGPIVVADAADMRSVLLNIATNAAEALAPQGGEIKIRVGTSGVPEGAHLHRHPLDWAPHPVPYAFLEVEDNGAGMDPGVMERLFDPFFSTKFTGRGLGLAVVFGVVRAMNGGILVESRPGKGSCFRVYFPLYSGEAAERR